jgi:hypothetical protein
VASAALFLHLGQLTGLLPERREAAVLPQVGADAVDDEAITLEAVDRGLAVGWIVREVPAGGYEARESLGVAPMLGAARRQGERDLRGPDFRTVSQYRVSPTSTNPTWQLSPSSRPGHAGRSR